jgi:hypothetical protein
MIETRHPRASGRAFDRETTAKAVYTALVTILDQIDYTNQACSPAEPIAGVLDQHLIAKAHAALRNFNEARADIETPRLRIPD